MFTINTYEKRFINDELVPIKKGDVLPGGLVVVGVGKSLSCFPGGAGIREFFVKNT